MLKNPLNAVETKTFYVTDRLNARQLDLLANMRLISSSVVPTGLYKDQ